VPGIKAVTFREDTQKVELVEGRYTKLTQYVLDTDGSNYVKVMNHPLVDGTKVSSTNVWDVYEVLGIEATRATLFNEISNTFSDVDVNYRHLCLLCDVMTRSGGACTNIRDLLGVISFGVIKTVSSPAALEIVKSVLESGFKDSPSTQISLFGEFSKSSLRIYRYSA
jgi:DNA-directed RNA polymerase II subunit RPB1